MSAIDEAVRARYARAALELKGAASSCGGGTGDCCGGGTGDCCGGGPGDCGASYDAAEVGEAGLSAGLSLGCGNPTALAELRPGEVVLDLGSGGGLDVILSARRVSPGGRAYGVDMTDEMLALAERNRERAGVDNATFLRGSIQQVPLPEASVDVVISNCVINLVEDKGAVFGEAFRLLRPGGRLAVADMVEMEPLDAATRADPEAWAGCVAGAISAEEYSRLLVEAGFETPEIEVHSTVSLPDRAGRVGSAHIRARKPGGGAPSSP